MRWGSVAPGGRRRRFYRELAGVDQATLRVGRNVMAVVSHRDGAVLRLAVEERQSTVRRTAEQLRLSRAVAGATLRAERAGQLHGQLIGGGEIGYSATARGRERLDEPARGTIAAKP